MKNKKKLITTIASSLLSVLLAICLVETVTYAGFYLKYFNVSVGVGTGFLFLFSIFIFSSLYGKKIIQNGLFIASLTLSIIYVILDILEMVNYLNYVFSHFHIHLYLLLLSVLLLLLLTVINNTKKRLDTLIHFLVVLTVAKYLVNGINKTRISNVFFIFKNKNLTYGEKMKISVGDLTYDYAVFIKENTESDSTILIPPQGYPWPQTGNKAYLRYFIYPRTLVNGNEKDSKADLSDIDYVLIAYGETTISEYGFTNVWPKFNVIGEYIIYWDPETGEINKDETGIYEYNESDKSKKWGLIKTKH